MRLGVLKWTLVAAVTGCLQLGAEDENNPQVPAPNGDPAIQNANLFLVLDEDSIDNGLPPNFFSDVDVNDQIAEVGVRETLRYFRENAGEVIDLHTGQVEDEGWFAPMSIPSSWRSAGPTDDGIKNFLVAGPGLGSEGGSYDREDLLDKIPDVKPLREAELYSLVGRTVCAVVYDSDVSINYSPLNGSLKGANLGTVSFEVLEVWPRTDGSSSSLPGVTILIQGPNECDGPVFPMFDPPNEPGGDADGDGIPNHEDGGDSDGDGIPDSEDPTPGGDPNDPNAPAGDADGDGIPNATDPDDDNDGVPDGADPDGNVGPGGDADGDGIPDAVDPDRDGDGVPDDVDGDGDPDVTDPDDDNDGIPDAQDPTPNGQPDPIDGDGDGTPDLADADDDGDGIPDAIDPDRNGDGVPEDVDGDGIPNASDTDDDNDGVPDDVDADDDNDGVPDGTDPDWIPDTAGGGTPDPTNGGECTTDEECGTGFCRNGVCIDV